MTEAERLAQALTDWKSREVRDLDRLDAAAELRRLAALSESNAIDALNYESRIERLQAENDALRADAERAKVFGDLLCELIEHPAAGPFTDNIDSDLLHRWQDACDAAIDAARKG